MKTLLARKAAARRPRLVYQAKVGNPDVLVATFDKAPVMRSLLTPYNPSEAYKKKIKQLHHLEQITNREEIKLHRDMRKTYAREVAAPLLLYKLIEHIYGKYAGSGAFQGRAILMG